MVAGATRTTTTSGGPVASYIDGETTEREREGEDVQEGDQLTLDACSCSEQTGMTAATGICRGRARRAADGPREDELDAGPPSKLASAVKVEGDASEEMARSDLSGWLLAAARREGWRRGDVGHGS